MVLALKAVDGLSESFQIQSAIVRSTHFVATRVEQVNAVNKTMRFIRLNRSLQIFNKKVLEAIHSL